MKFPLSQCTVYTTIFCYMAVIDNCGCFKAQLESSLPWHASSYSRNSVCLWKAMFRRS